ncbi:DegT/DnrJ/EryC1/StrS family aminotransferase [Paenibacillus oceani]|uniref:DegT/DnrJ/EryC1/StrS family aminotransferase n=1 Tax=Paenibacillus oceani TaxID=2772510 RepID=A0A927GY75_9BACL|nr:DegT/DnrJ/EryC1/StrS family aminotransferase [Paenibacillus oceani]MBD2860747.1 DegT/DnrJ/EryC1/StrS family aminotransferase [Paenibacillus oceani]
MNGYEKLALLGGTKAIDSPNWDMFKWPIITDEDEAAALQVLRNGAMSGIDITMKFEKEFAEWLNMDYALAFNNGTSSLLGAFYGCGIGVGDEVICPSITYWASALSAYSLGASIVFAEIDPLSLCLDPNDSSIGSRTKRRRKRQPEGSKPYSRI